LCSGRGSQAVGKMRKSLWILALLLVVALAAPNVWADSFDASFTCASSCSSVPTDPFITFPSPNIPISFFGQSFSITLDGSDNPTDSFTWNVVTSGSNWYFQINDVTNGKSDAGAWFSCGGGSAPWGSGDVVFDHATAPEPYSGALLLLGLGVVFAVRKFMPRGLPQAC